jgi:hypothetical protein
MNKKEKKTTRPDGQVVFIWQREKDSNPQRPSALRGAFERM